MDRNWWLSNYSVKSFIPLNFIEDPLDANCENILQQYCGGLKCWNFALLFCYFNNHEAFLKYLEQFKGKWLIIIGPSKNKGVHSDPQPMCPNFACNMEWVLHSAFDIGDFDIMAIYENKKL